MCIWFRKLDLPKALANVMNHQEEAYVKRVIIQILRRYAYSTTNTIDDALVDEIETRLLFPERHQAQKQKVELETLVHFTGYENE